MTTRLTPYFRELPLYRNTVERHAWGVFGEDDELGALNRITATSRRRGIDAIRSGELFSLNWDMDLPSPALFGRKSIVHTRVDSSPVHVGTDDFYDSFYTQSSTQWDALSHVGTPLGDFYNGRSEPEVHAAERPRLGIANVGSVGIAGRFVLLDIARYRDFCGTTLDCAHDGVITAQEMDDALAWQGVDVHEGDILLLRTGWLEWYERLDVGERETVAAQSRALALETPGIEPSQAVAEWIWDRGFAAITADNPNVEPTPCQFDSWDGYLHYRLIPLLGITIGELFSLGDLAAACARDRHYDGLLTAAPFNKTGGSGSPGNALALR